MRIVSVFTSILVGAAASFSTQAAPLNICHVANAGFLISAKDAAVVIDAVMEKDSYDGRFSLPSPSTLASLQKGTGQFEQVKVALVSHLHGDHFDPVASLQHMRRNKHVEYVMPPEAYQMLLSSGLTNTEQKRVHSVLPDWKSGPLTITVNDIPIEVFRIDHGPDMPQNLGYRVTLGSHTVFHTGDINASAERLGAAGLNKIPVDIMLMPFWNILERKDTIDKAWNIKTMIPMHYHAQAQPWMEQFGGPEGLRATTEAEWPNAVRIDQEMQCKTLP